MRLTLCLAGLVATLANAQNATNEDYGRERTVLRLNADLANLNTVPADIPLVALGRCIAKRGTTAQRPQQCASVDQITDDLALVKGTSSRYPADSLGPSLIQALSGRELEPGALMALAISVVDLVSSVNQAIAAQESLSASRPFQELGNRARAALVALGVPEMRAEMLLTAFAGAAEKRTHPRSHLLEPIPPAYRPLDPEAIPR